MSRFSIYKLAASERARHQELVARLLARTESAEEFRQLVMDLFSVSEITMLARRLMVAVLLEDGLGHDMIRARLACSKDLVRDVAGRLAKGGKSLAKSVVRLKTIASEMQQEIAFAIKSEVPTSPEGFARKSPTYFWTMHADVTADRELRNLVSRVRRSVAAKKKKTR